MYSGDIYEIFCTMKVEIVVTSTYWSIVPSGVDRNVVLSAYDVILGNWWHIGGLLVVVKSECHQRVFP